MVRVDTPRVLSVSTYLFRLMTEAVRLRSNELGRFATLSSLISERAASMRGDFRHHEAQILRGHFSTVPTKGPIEVELHLSEPLARHLDSAAEQLGARVDIPATAGDAISALLFDYVVDRKARELLGGLGFDMGVAHSEEPSPAQSVTRA